MREPKPFRFFIVSAFLLAISIAGARTADASDAEKLLYELKVPLSVGSDVTVSLPDGTSKALGKVVLLPERTRWPSYTASAWGTPGSVTASAVNAVHLLIDVEQGKGRTMSVIPKETIAPAAGPGASVVVDSPAGTGFFGAWAPPIGTTIMVQDADGSRRHLAAGSLPKEGEYLVFQVFESSVPYFVEFENRPGGRVMAWGTNGAALIARVIRPVQGVGRFEGTLFQDCGRIRASHSGVIDVSTSPRGIIGGFQIIPWEHALKSKEMQGVWTATQWMVLAPPDGESPLGGRAPLFGGGLIPGPADGEELWDIWSTYGRRPLVLARLDGGEWEKLPEAGGKVDDALARVTHIRIYFPIDKEPLSE